MTSETLADNHATRLNALTGLRWWAAFAVFLAHMRNLAPLPGTFEIFQFGNYGVMFFFILSGFVLTWSARATTKMKTFYVNRFARIWPAAFVALLLAVPVFYSFSPDPSLTFIKPFEVGVLLLSIVLLQGWSRDPVITFSGNPAAWTLTIEMFFYALHPFFNRILRLFSLRNTLIATAALVTLSFGSRYLTVTVPGLFLTSLPFPVLRLNEFVLGMLIAHAMRLGWRIRLPFWVPAVLLVSIVAVDRIARRDGLAADLAYYFIRFENELLLVGFTALIISVAMREISGKKSWFAIRLNVILGEWSFTFYLVHATVIYALVILFGVHRNGWDNLYWYIPALAGSLILAGAVHLWVEKPFERMIRRGWAARLKRRSTTEPILERVP